MRPTLLALAAFAALVPAAAAGDPPPFPTLGKPGDAIHFAAVPLTKPKKSADRIDGGLNHVFFSLWLPEGVGTVRGIYLMPFNLNGVEQEQSRAMCRHWRFALVGGNFMRVDRAEYGPLLLAGLKDLAGDSKHPEVAHAPLIAAGMSAGVGMCVSLAEQLPDRFIACGLACLEVGPETERTRGVPVMTVFGEKDGRQMAQLEDLLPRRRAAFAASWAITPQWGRRHEWGRANNLLWPFFDEVIGQRLPADADPSAGPVALRPCDPAGAWLGDPASWKGRAAVVAPAGKYAGDPAKACWLPGPRTAHAWQAFAAYSPAVRIAAPPPQEDGKPLTVLGPADKLTVTVEADAATPDGPFELYDGAARLVGGALKDRKGVVEVGPLPAGVHTLIARTGPTDRYAPSRPVVVLVAGGRE